MSETQRGAATVAASSASAMHNGNLLQGPPNKNANMAVDGNGMHGSGGSPATPPPNKQDFGSTHRVKKLLETYIGTAGHTLTGPANSSLEDPPYKQHRSSSIIQRSHSSPPPLSLPQPQRPTYKLPADIELSKTVDDDDEDGVDEDEMTSASAHNKSRMMLLQHHHQQQMQERYYAGKLSNGDQQQQQQQLPSPHSATEVSKGIANGRVTLSR
jgi:hypothetical protein